MNAAAVIALGLILVVLVAHYLEARAARRLQQTIAARLTDLSPHDRQTEIMPPPMEQELRARAAEEPAHHGPPRAAKPSPAEPSPAEPPPTRRLTRSPILPPGMVASMPPSSPPPKAPTFGPPPPLAPAPPSAGARARTQRPPAPELPRLTARGSGATEMPPDSGRTLLSWPAPPQRADAPGNQ